jgi:predicted amidohydrolase
MNFEHN